MVKKLQQYFDVPIIRNAPPWKWTQVAETCRRYTVCAFMLRAIFLHTLLCNNFVY